MKLIEKSYHNTRPTGKTLPELNHPPPLTLHVRELRPRDGTAVPEARQADGTAKWLANRSSLNAFPAPSLLELTVAL